MNLHGDIQSLEESQLVTLLQVPDMQDGDGDWDEAVLPEGLQVTGHCCTPGHSILKAR